MKTSNMQTINLGIRKYGSLKACLRLLINSISLSEFTF